MGPAMGGGTPRVALALRVEAYSWQSAIARNRLVALGDRPIIVGSDPGCDIAIYDAAIAPRHAAIVPVAVGGHAVEDLGSATGTWVQGARIAQPVQLVGGESIRIGEAELIVTALVPAAPAGQPAPAATPPVTSQPTPQPPMEAAAARPLPVIPALPAQPAAFAPPNAPSLSERATLPEGGRIETVPYCPLCALSYPPGATVCAVCGSQLTEAIVS